MKQAFKKIIFYTNKNDYFLMRFSRLSGTSYTTINNKKINV